MTSPKRISLRELHERTGSLVREAAAGGYAVVVTDRGRPVATIVPYAEHDERRRFRDRALSPAFAAIQKRRIKGDSSLGISEDRDRF